MLYAKVELHGNIPVSFDEMHIQVTNNYWYTRMYPFKTGKIKIARKLVM